MLRLLARAKINWSLDILGVRPDGYHQMDMLMESIELADELTLEPADTLTLTISGNGELSVENNLVIKAANTLRQACGEAKGARMALHKRIPCGAGMGGGSADAAAALIGLARLWGQPLCEESLCQLALCIGADVPFLLRGGLARVGGIGEEIVPLKVPAPVPLVIVQPCQALATGEVFAAYDALPSPAHPDTGTAQNALARRDWALLASSAGNVLQTASEAKRPQIAEAVAALDGCGAAFAAMTGSGSAVFGAFERVTDAQAAYRLLRKRWKRCWLTSTAPQGITYL